MATFGLIHGAWHGAWCWARLVPELERRGHRAIAADLPIDDPDADMDTWADSAAAMFQGASGPLILVGHSLGGVLLPLVAARLPAMRQVYLAAILHPALVPAGAPEPHAPRTFAGLERFPDGSHRWPSLEVAAPVMYSACTTEEARWAFEHLRRQQTARPWAQVSVPEPWPATPLSAIVCDGDRTILPSFGDWAARTVLGVEPLHLDADHAPFLSRPAPLAAMLATLAGA